MEKRMTSEYQRKVSDFVGREVNMSLHEVISHLQKDEEMKDIIFGFSSKPDTEEGYEDNFIEALEFWSVSDWLADKLINKDELVGKDFLGLNVWGRTDSGQRISIDNVICEIYDDLQKI